MEKNKMRFFKQTLAIMVLTALTFMAGCGGSSNDQGVTFTALGFFQVTEEDGVLEIDPDVGITGVGGVIGGGSTLVAIGLQNNLCCQFIRTERLKLTHYIPGAAIQPPDTAVPLSAVINPTPTAVIGENGEQQTVSGASSLPDGFVTGEASVGYYVMQPLRPEISEWLLFNKASLPDTPFSMVVSATVTGVTSAGNRLETNPVDLNVTVFDIAGTF